MDRYDALVEALQVEVPGFRIVRKDRSRLHQAIHYALIGLTFGRMRSYLDSYQTTIGRTVYVTSDWEDWEPDRRYVTLRHEAVHLRQFRTYTLPGMAVLYVLLPLPMGLAWFRAYFEKEAYAESIRAAAEVYGPGYPRRTAYRRYVLDQFMGASYGWMWPFRAGLERWYDEVLATLEPLQQDPCRS
ncbi:MAG: hypothetical protein H0X17_04960 [Deltaproteobacteria bacterium]|nr:hypothetical protein [Deltaproteobacteria bacterium]